MIKRIRTFLEQWGIHSLLLPIFFVLHNYNQYYGLVSVSTGLTILLKLIVMTLVIALLFLIFTRHINKSLQLTTLLSLVILFYGVIKDFLHSGIQTRFISKYSILLPIVLIITILFTSAISKIKDYKKINLFQNILLLIFILLDGSLILATNNYFFLKKNLLTNGAYLNINSLPKPHQTPDVFYLVFDSYPGTTFLNDYMSFDNSPFSQLLEEKGFHVLKNPKSNYNRTAFSIASTLNFEYLQNIKSFTPINPKDYAQASLTIKESVVPKVFKKYNYAFYNLSVFNIDGAAPIRKETFLTMPEKNILLYNTLPERLKNDLLWNLIVGKHAVKAIGRFFVQDRTEFQKEQEERNDFNN